METDLSVQTRSSIQSLLGEISLEESLSAAADSSEEKLLEETSVQEVLTDKAQLEEILPLEEFNFGDEIFSDLNESQAEPSAAPKHRANSNNSFKVQSPLEDFLSAQMVPSLAWREMLFVLSGRWQPPLAVETADSAASATVKLNPAQMSWRETLRLLAGRAVAPETLATDAQAAANLQTSSYNRWPSRATRSPGLNVSELLGEIDFS